MKKRIVSIVVLAILAIGLYPQSKIYKDGGTKIYTALVYTYISFNTLEGCTANNFAFFPNNRNDYEYYHKQVCENKNTNSIGTKTTEENDAYIFKASGFEPSWEISIEDNIVYYNAPETYDEITETIQNIPYTITKKQEGNNFYFEGGDIRAEFIQKDCVTDGRGDTLAYTVSLTREGDMVYSGCGYLLDKSIVQDDFFTRGEEKPITELEGKLDLNIFEATDSREGISFTVSDIYKNYVMIEIIDQGGMGYSSLFKKEGNAWKQIWEGQDIDDETCKNISQNHSDIAHWGVFVDCK